MFYSRLRINLYHSFVMLSELYLHFYVYSIKTRVCVCARVCVCVCVCVCNRVLRKIFGPKMEEVTGD